MNWRKALEWWCWNPKRFFLCAAGVILLVIVIGAHASGGTHHKPTVKVGKVSLGLARHPSSTIGTATGSGSTAAPSTTLPQDARQAAVTFVTDYARPDLPESTWYDALEPLATTQLDNVLADEQPWSVTAHRVTGAATGSGNLVTVPTDAGPIYVTLQSSGGKWLVSDVEQAS